jgi:hypothetical protein
MATAYYRQCTLDRQLAGARMVLTTWLPEKYAVMDRVLELQDRNSGEWHNGWVVRQVGTVRKPEPEVVERSQDHKRTRKASDI